MKTRSFAARFGLSASLAAACALTAPLAQANPSFPSELQAAAMMPCLPHCTLCHNTDLGGPGNIRPNSMGQTWVMYGLDGAVAGSLNAALLMNLEVGMQDTDG